MRALGAAEGGLLKLDYAPQTGHTAFSASMTDSIPWSRPELVVIGPVLIVVTSDILNSSILWRSPSYMHRCVTLNHSTSCQFIRTPKSGLLSEHAKNIVIIIEAPDTRYCLLTSSQKCGVLILYTSRNWVF